MDGKKFLAELIGTFGFVFFGAGAILTHVSTQMVGMTGIAVAHGIGILVMIYAFGHISGGHFNPAVTMGVLVGRRIRFGGAISYWAAQLLGAVLAALVLRAAYGGPTEANLGAPAVAAGVSPMAAMFLEALMAFILVIVVFGSAVHTKAPIGFAGLAIGLTLTGNILAGGALTGAAFNPARAFGPALIAGFWQDQWLYWVGPLLGGAIGGLLYTQFFLDRDTA